MVFSDESTISILDDRVQTVRRRKGEEFDPQCSKENGQISTENHGLGCHFCPRNKSFTLCKWYDDCSEVHFSAADTLATTN